MTSSFKIPSLILGKARSGTFSRKNWKVLENAQRTVRFLMRSYVQGPGSGVGKGGGGGGTVREAGGAFGVMEAAREDQYFHKKNRKQLENLKKHLEDQIEFHEQAIASHRKAIEESKSRSKAIDKHVRGD